MHGLIVQAQYERVPESSKADFVQILSHFLMSCEGQEQFILYAWARVAQVVRRDIEMRPRNRTGEAVGEEEKGAGTASASGHLAGVSGVSGGRIPAPRKTHGLGRI